jgi:DNA-binding IclR family transcriptional regulator
MAKDDHSAVDRVVNILEFIADNKDGATFTDIMRGLSIPKSSLHPLIHTLCKRRFVHYSKNSQRYFLGDGIFSLGSEYVTNTNLLGLIDDALEELAKSVGETCYFGVLAEDEVLYLLKQNSTSPIQVTARPGYRLKAYASAIGKALLSQFEKSELISMYSNGIEPITQNTVKNIDSLYDQLSEARESGFFYEREESSLHVQCVATPVFYKNKVTAALSIAFPVFTSAGESEKIHFKKEKLTLARQRVEDTIARNRADWVYGD